MTATAVVEERPRPFLKWVGGKTQLLPELHKAIPASFWKSKTARYFEPFLGGGALFFDLRSRGWGGFAVLTDLNPLLVGTYIGVRGHVERAIKDLAAMHYDRDEYCNRRAHQPDPTVAHPEDIAAWFIYMNRTCFNGLWRVNKKGQFNVPFGKYANPTICNAQLLRECSRALKNTASTCHSFELAVTSAKKGDLVYFDPPYVPVSATADFTSYTGGGFKMNDQQVLRTCAWKLRERGVHVILSNSDTPAVRLMYRDFNIRRVEARRNVNSKGSARGPVGELIIT